MALDSFIHFAHITPNKIPNTKPPTSHSTSNRSPLSKDTFSWNSDLQAHLIAGEPYLAVLTYRDMLIAGVLPDRHTLPRALTASRLSSALFTGRQIHSHALKLRLYRDSYVLLSLMDLYAQVGGANAASSLISYSNPQTPIAYTLLAKFYLMENNPDSALQVFYQMAISGIQIDPIAVATALKACVHLKSVRDGKKVLEFARERKLDCDVLVLNSLLKMYIECGRMEESLDLFKSMPFKDVVSWTTIINSIVKKGLFNDGLNHFREMIVDGERPDEFAVCAVLPACARMAARKHGMEIHGFVIRHQIGMSTAVHNAFIDMYAKSGSIETASKMFVKMPERDVVSWTVMILGYSFHGLGELGVALFHEIGSEPDRALYAAALHACGTDCIVDEGEKIFKMIRLELLETEHYVLMTRILARSGRFVQLWSFMEENCMEKDLSALRAVLDGCRIHSNVRMGKRVVEQLIELNPLIAENYVLLSNMYASNGKYNKAKEVRDMVADMGLKTKKAGSWIEVRGKIHAFGTGDISHPRSERIYWELNGLMGKMKEEGYVHLEDFSLHDVDEEMECVPRGHSEMLAVAFGLISTPASTVVRVTKNMRVCRNCHESVKWISRITERKIVLKDPERFHWFDDGSCSCQDVW